MEGSLITAEWLFEKCKDGALARLHEWKYPVLCLLNSFQIYIYIFIFIHTPKKKGIADAAGNDGNASMPEQVKRPDPWRKKRMVIYCNLCVTFNTSSICNLLNTSLIMDSRYANRTPKIAIPNKMSHTTLPKGRSAGVSTKIRVNFECEISNLMGLY